MKMEKDEVEGNSKKRDKRRTNEKNGDRKNSEEIGKREDKRDDHTRSIPKKGPQKSHFEKKSIRSFTNGHPKLYRVYKF